VALSLEDTMYSKYSFISLAESAWLWSSLRTEGMAWFIGFGNYAYRCEGTN
jgi:hypothetical protein